MIGGGGIHQVIPLNIPCVPKNVCMYQINREENNSLFHSLAKGPVHLK